MNRLPDCFLFPHEWEALKSVLQRDISNELLKASIDNELASWHWRNARISQRIFDLMFTRTAPGELAPTDRTD